MSTQNFYDSHLKRFHGSPAPHLSGYGVFFGDDRQVGGEPLPTGSLRRNGTGTLRSSEVLRTSMQDFKSGYQVRTTVPLNSLRNTMSSTEPKILGGQVAQATTRTGQGMALSARKMDSSTLSGTAYVYTTGTFISESGLPPTQYKAWTSEYGDEYRGPKERKANLQELTMVHGTTDALKSSRFQFRGYPFNHKTFSATSLTARGQNAPNYESRVVGY